MKKSAFGLMFRHYLLRSAKGWMALLIFTVLPLATVAITTIVYTGTLKYSNLNGYNMVATYNAYYMMLLFQLNGGLYLLGYLHHDFMEPMKWRLKAAPFHESMAIFAGIAACTVFTFLQGALIILVTTLFFNVYWGNIPVALLAVLFISLTSQFLNIFYLLAFKSVGAGEGLSWVAALIMTGLSGALFPLPDNGFFRFMQSYGTPFALARNAITESGFLASRGGNPWLFLGLLAGECLLLAIISIPLGRRRLT